jgi:plastocyanin
MDSLRTLSPLSLIAVVLALAGCGGGDSSSGGEPTATTPTQSAEEVGEEGQEAAEEAGEEAEEAAEQATGHVERSAKVEIANFAYDPDPVQVAVGGKVIWQNMDSVPHSATAEDGSFDTGLLQEGKLKSETFKTAGTYTYTCSVHPEMHGTVEVLAE